MSWPSNIHDIIKRLKSISENMKDLFTGRDEAVDLMILATVSHEHLLLIGPPGTAKTGLISRYCQFIDAREFHYLLSRFTEPSELFGPLDLSAFNKGTYHVRTEGMLPEAQIAFLDEVFQGSSPILNSLLTLINERVYFNGPIAQSTPLISLIGASNLIPDDQWLKAFSDRFLLRLQIRPTLESEIDDLLDKGWALETENIQSLQSKASGKAPVKSHAPLTVADIGTLHSCLLQVGLSEVRREYSRVMRELRAEGIDLSDRRIVKGLKLVAAAALLREDTDATVADLWPLLHLWSRPEEAETIRGIVEPRLAAAGTPARTARPVSEILEDLAVRVDQERFLTGETAWGAHVVALNKLRRELINSHPKETDARKQVERAIQRGLQRMGTVRV